MPQLPDALPEAFPWSDSNDLSAVLDDKTIWSRLLTKKYVGKNFLIGRRQIKKIIKGFDLKGARSVIAIENDDSFGQALAELMKLKAGRKAIEAHFYENTTTESFHALVAQCIFDFSRESETDWQIDQFCEKRAGDRYFLSLEMFEQWQRRSAKVIDEQIEKFAIMACSFAWLQPEIRESLYAVLVKARPEIAQLLGNNQPVRNIESEVLNKDEWRVSSKMLNSSVVQTVPQQSVVADPTAGILAATSFNAEWELDTDLASFNQLKKIHSVLSDRVREVQAQISRLTNLKKVALDNLFELTSFFENEPRFQELLVVPDVDGLPLESACNQLNEFASLVQQIRRSIVTCRELRDRLGKTVKEDVFKEGNLVVLRESVDYELASLLSEVDELAKIDQQVSSLFRDFLNEPIQERPSLIRLYESTEFELIATAVFGSGLKTNVDSELENIRGDFRVLGILAVVWFSKNPIGAAKFVDRALTMAAGDRVKSEQVLSYLSFDDLYVVVERFPDRLGIVCEFTLGAALAANDFKRLSNLERFLVHPPASSSAIWEVYSELSKAAASSSTLDLSTTLKTAKLQVENPDAVKDRLLAMIHKRASSAGGALFHTLRESAREKFMRPLTKLIERKEIDKALKAWKAQGDLHAKVELCLSELVGREKRHLETKHKINTESYLANFEQGLLAFADGATSKKSSDNSLGNILAKFKSQKSATDNCSKRLLELLETPQTSKGLMLPSHDFGVRCLQGVVNEQSLTFVTAIWFNSWVAVCEGQQVSAGLLLADYLSLKLGDLSPQPDVEMIERYLGLGLYSTARQAAKDHDALETLVEHRLDEKKSKILSDCALEAAKNFRYDNENIDVLIRFLHESLDEDNFCDAESYLRELAIAVQDHQFLNDPVNRRLNKFLTELGVSDSPRDRSEMELLVADAIELAKSRRFHIDTINEYKEKVPECLRLDWQNSAEFLDMPMSWPHSEDVSLELASWVEYFGEFIVVKWKSTKQATLATDSFEVRLSNWFLQKLKKCLCNPDAPDFSGFEAIKSGRDKQYWESTQILEFIFADSPDLVVSAEIGSDFQRTENVTPAIPMEAVLPPQIGRAAEVDSQPKITKVLSSFRRTFAQFISMEPKSQAERRDIVKLCIQFNWQAVREEIATYENITDDLPEGEFLEEECVYAFALASSVDEKSLEFRKLADTGFIGLAALQIFFEKYYFSSDRLLLNFLNLFSKTISLRSIEVGNPRDRLVAYLTHIVNAPHGDARRKFLDRLLRTCEGVKKSTDTENRGDFVIANWIWEACTGATQVDFPRSDLLFFLYQLKQFDLLNLLAKRYASSLHSSIITCLEEFNQGDSNPTALEDAQRLARIIIEQSTREKISPWKRLISKLDKAPKDYSTEEQFRVVLQSMTICGSALQIFIQLIPPRYDYPDWLEIQLGRNDEFGKGPIELLSGRPLTKPLLKTIQIPMDKVHTVEGFVRIPYEVKGKSDKSSEISDLGTWTLDNISDSQVHRRLELDQLNRYWPGADGKDLKIESNHHGREDAMRKIELALAGGDGYQKSLFIIGQRRIGKTSLLNQVVNCYPPKQGGTCAVFADISGLRRQHPSLAAALIDKIFDQIEFAAGEKNKAVLATFEKTGSQFRRLTKDLNTRRSVAGALEGLAQLLSSVTNGRINRIAFCLDEFHSVFSWRDEKEVNDLMWDLRSIVQGSKSVSLLMAGSGLTRRLIDSIQQPLFGSIETIELQPFSLEKEHDAIAKTFLPKEFRNDVAPTSEDYENLLLKAHEITGGHPWYLAILGSSMASLFGLTKVTPAMLSHVMEELVEGRLDRIDKTYSPSYFYGHLVQSLDVLGERQTAISKLVLLEVARNTTSDFPWLWEKKIQNDETLATLCSKREVAEALKTLCRELVLEKTMESKNSKYRIKVPLVAAALKKDASELDMDAISRLQEMQPYPDRNR